VHPPFVMKADDAFQGMAIALWQWLSSRLELASEFVEFSNVGELTCATASGAIDVAVTSMTGTKERAEQIDFTHPWFDAGQRIMIKEGGGGGLSNLFSGLRESGHMRAYTWIVIVIGVATIFVTLFDRRFDKDYPRRWRDGLAEG